MSALPPEIAAPNWDQITTEPQCPLCEYMLRGLNTPRCPECGYTFSWREVLDVSIREHPYLFEHYPNRPIWSFFKTWAGALRPHRFWRQLHPLQRGSVSRLLSYWMIGFGVWVACLMLQPAVRIAISIAIGGTVVLHPHSRWGGAPPTVLPFWKAVENQIYQVYSRSRVVEESFALVAIVGAWPWVTYLALQLYGISMRKARIGRIHVLRCVLYSFDSSYLLLALLISTAFRFNLFNQPYYYGFLRGRWTYAWQMLPFMLAALAVAAYRLAVAYTTYLRFRHVAVVVVSSQIITALVVAIVALTIVLA